MVSHWIRYQVSGNRVGLHINGEFYGIQSPWPNTSRVMLFVGGSDLLGYVYKAEFLPLCSSIKDAYQKDPPLMLAIDESTSFVIGEAIDYPWTLVSDNGSCRMMFSFDVVLINAMGHLVHREMEIVASLVYDDERLTVKLSSDDKDPLKVISDGVDFAASERPVILLNGRAYFKLKIPHIPSIFEKRTFRIKFESKQYKGYRFLESFSRSIRCISVAHANLKGSASFRCKSVTNLGCNGDHSSPKRLKVGQGLISSLRQVGEDRDRHVWTDVPVHKTCRMKMEDHRHAEINESSSDSERTEDENMHPKTLQSPECSVSDSTIFKYCLGGAQDRASLLKDIVNTISEEGLAKFAHAVSLYSGCTHHRQQILISKRLIQGGTKVWNSIARNNPSVLWENAMPEFEKQYMKIARSFARSLTKEDYAFLKSISGCGDVMIHENFERMWCWLYPVAITLSKDVINKAWCCATLKWIEGFITKEEAELSLQSSHGMQPPGTFILRFPNSRSWPHPDAGNLVVTYVGHDYHVHHRLLSLDCITSSCGGKNTVKSLQDILLEDPSLSMPGRVIRPL